MIKTIYGKVSDYNFELFLNAPNKDSEDFEIVNKLILITSIVGSIEHNIFDVITYNHINHYQVFNLETFNAIDFKGFQPSFIYTYDKTDESIILDIKTSKGYKESFEDFIKSVEKEKNPYN